MRYLKEEEIITLICDIWNLFSRESLLDAVGGGGDGGAVEASLLLEHRLHRVHVPGQHGRLQLYKTEMSESSR